MNEQKINPLYDEGTITFTPSNTRKEISRQKYIADPLRVIPNGIYKVIKWEVIRLIIAMIISVTVLITSSTFILVYALHSKPSWLAYVIPTITGIVSLYKTLDAILSYRYTKVSIKKYREDVKIGISYAPVFIQKMYKNLYANQVKHNWITFFIIFWLGLATLLLWWLKDFNWWILDFASLVRMMFTNPDMMVWIFTSVIIATTVIQLVYMIQRKKKILEIDAYFGEQLEPPSRIEEMKLQLNKSWRRFFFWSVIIVLVIPFITLLFIRAIRKRR